MFKGNVSAAVVLLLLLAAQSVIMLSGSPPASALGCAPISLWSEGPYRSSLKGFIGFDKETVGIRHGVKDVYVIEPGTSASMTFSFTNFIELRADPGAKWAIMPYLGFFDATPPDASWLSASFTPDPVLATGNDEKVNVTVTFSVAKDAPPGEYGVEFGGRLGSADPLHCSYGSKEFILRVGREKPSHAFTLYLSSVSGGRADVEQLTEGGRLAGLRIALEKNSFAKLTLKLSSDYPYTLYFNWQVANMSLRSASTDVQGLDTKINVTGITWDQGRYFIGQHRSGNIMLTFTARDGVKDGDYSAYFTADAYPTPIWFTDPKIETVEIPIMIQIGTHDTVSGTVTKTMTSTSTSTTTDRSIITETSTKTILTTIILTSTTATTSIERLTESTGYVWAIGSTAIVIVLFVVLILKRRKT